MGTSVVKCEFKRANYIWIGRDTVLIGLFVGDFATGIIIGCV